MNKAILTGNITRDLEIRKTQTDKSVLEFSIAINEGYGEFKHTEYVNIVAWDKLADRIGRYCSKGSKIMVEGRIKTDSYEKNGSKVYKTYVIANNVEFLSSKEHQEPTKADQPPLTRDDGKDMFGRKQNIEFETDELPFY